ncbi:tenascin-R-like isoform X2 [Denticeps clupeoides]|uniref:tenascin-R-like isoform X2 n=1 Tax=Denticeps clupeoides TaxID=299321 RepID=UPI0010A2EEC8|nr:tenascin-R-like isoform X2 [Denticeps clupeoides]
MSQLGDEDQHEPTSESRPPALPERGSQDPGKKRTSENKNISDQSCAGKFNLVKPQSVPLRWEATGDPAGLPAAITLTPVSSDSVALKCEETDLPIKKFRLSWRKTEDLHCVDIPGLKYEIHGLDPGQKYDFTVCVLGEDDRTVASASGSLLTEVPPPEDVKVQNDGQTVSVSWAERAGLEEAWYLVSFLSGGVSRNSVYTKYHECSHQLDTGEEHNISISTVLRNGKQSKAVEKTVVKGSFEGAPAPDLLHWSKESKPDKPEPISTESSSTELTELKPETDYEITAWTELKHGGTSQPAASTFRTFRTAPPTSLMDQHRSVQLSLPIASCPHGATMEPTPKLTGTHLDRPDQPISNSYVLARDQAPPTPQNLTVESVSATAAKLGWSLESSWSNWLKNPYTFLISYLSKGTLINQITTEKRNTEIKDLQPSTEYEIRVYTVNKQGQESLPALLNFHTGQVPAPENLSIEVNVTSVSVRWSKLAGVDQVSYRLSYSSEGEEEQTISTKSLHHVLHDLRFYTEYKIRVCTVLNNLHHSKPVYKNIRTGVPAPEKVTVVSVSATSAKISWIPPHGMDQIPHSFRISHRTSGGTEAGSICPGSDTEFKHLKPDTVYTLTVCTELEHGGTSQPATVTFRTEKYRFYTQIIGRLPGQNIQPVKDFLKSKGLVEAESEEKCDVVLAFCLIVSRAGTDIQAALAAIKETRPVILVVMHHTFDPDHVVPQSSRFIKRENILITVDCLFHEDQGLLRSQQNDAAFTQIQHGLAQLN